MNRYTVVRHSLIGLNGLCMTVLQLLGITQKPGLLRSADPPGTNTPQRWTIAHVRIFQSGVNHASTYTSLPLKWDFPATIFIIDHFAAPKGAVFYALCFGENAPGRRAANRFVECFYTWETRTRTVEVENEDGTVTSTEEEYTVAVPVSLYQVYANLEAELGRTITEDDKSNINHIYTMIAGAAGGGSYSGEFLRGDGSSIDLDISAFVDPANKNAADLVTYAIHAWESGWGYVWGTYGNVLTESLLAYKVSQYPDGVGNHEDIIRANWLGGRTADCVGLIKGYGWLSPETMTIDYGTHGMPDIGANQMYYNAKESGPISTMPDIPGLAVWHEGHIGVYIGGGQVVEAMGTRYGVVKTELADRGWTHWLKVPYINYD